MDLAAYQRKYGHVSVEHRDWPVNAQGFSRFAARGPDSIGSAALAWNSQGQILLLRHLAEMWWGDLWATPGGFAEAGESPEACAIRETKEETGLVLTIAALTKVVVCHVTNEDHLLPYTFFQFEGESQGEPKPGQGIAEAAWLDRLPVEMHFRTDYLEPWMRRKPSL